MPAYGWWAGRGGPAGPIGAVMRPAAVPLLPCPICDGDVGVHRLAGTDRKVCTQCLAGIPLDMHIPDVTT